MKPGIQQRKFLAVANRPHPPVEGRTGLFRCADLLACALIELPLDVGQIGFLFLRVGEVVGFLDGMLGCLGAQPGNRLGVSWPTLAGQPFGVFSNRAVRLGRVSQFVGQRQGVGRILELDSISVGVVRGLCGQRTGDRLADIAVINRNLAIKCLVGDLLLPVDVRVELAVGFCQGFGFGTIPGRQLTGQCGCGAIRRSSCGAVVVILRRRRFAPPQVTAQEGPTIPQVTTQGRPGENPVPGRIWTVLVPRQPVTQATHSTTQPGTEQGGLELGRNLSRLDRCGHRVSTSQMDLSPGGRGLGRILHVFLLAPEHPKMLLEPGGHVLEHVAGDRILLGLDRGVELRNQLSEPVGQLVDNLCRSNKLDRHGRHGGLGRNPVDPATRRTAEDCLAFGHVVGDVGQGLIDRLEEIMEWLEHDTPDIPVALLEKQAQVDAVKN